MVNLRSWKLQGHCLSLCFHILGREIDAILSNPITCQTNFNIWGKAIDAILSNPITCQTNSNM